MFCKGDDLLAYIRLHQSLAEAIGLSDEFTVDALKVYFSTKCSLVPEYHFGAKCTSGSGVEEHFLKTGPGLEDHHQGQLVALVQYQKQYGEIGSLPDPKPLFCLVDRGAFFCTSSDINQYVIF